MVYIYNINELTLLPFFLSILRQKKVYVLSIEALFPPLQNFLQKQVHRQYRNGCAQDLMDSCPEIQHVRTYHISLLYYNIFRDTFDWHEQYYRFQEARDKLPDYAMAINLTCVNYTAGKQEPILLMDEAERVLPEKDRRFLGFLKDTFSMFGAFYRRPTGISGSRLLYPKRLINVSLFLVVSLISAGWVIARIRPFATPEKRYFLTIDFVGDTRDIRLAEEVSDGGPALFVMRLKTFNEQFRHLSEKFDIINFGDGILNFSEGFKAIGMCLWDGFRIFRLYQSCETPLYFKLATLPLRRAKSRAHVFTYPTDNYWGRDLYNPEHILRRQELKTVNGKSCSFLSGYGVLGDIAETLSYISFDRLYIIGQAFYEKYRRTWAPDMEVIPIGSYGVMPETAKRIRDRKEKPKDIVIFTSYVPLFNHPKLKAFIRGLAEEFPERKILLQLKSYFHKNETASAFIKECMDGLDNIHYTEAFLDELIDKAGYAFSDPATIIMETIQFYIPSFVIDVVEKHSYCIYREFPDLCQNDPHEAARLIRAMENGEWSYSFDSYKSLVEMPDISIFDQIRLDFGLSPAHIEPTNVALSSQADP